jgi:hypothetical protein
MAHGDAREGKWRGNWRMEWVASTLHTTSEHGLSSITTADAHTSAASSRLNWRPPADLNGLVRYAERRNLVSARVPSHFDWSLPKFLFLSRFSQECKETGGRVRLILRTGYVGCETHWRHCGFCECLIWGLGSGIRCRLTQWLVPDASRRRSRLIFRSRIRPLAIRSLRWFGNVGLVSPSDAASYPRRTTTNA